MASKALFLLLLLSSLALLLSSTSEAQTVPPVTKGLSYNFYSSKCPTLEAIVRDYLKKALQKDIGLAAGLLRVHFHDCFVQGCDASVLLDGSAGGPSEQEAPPNLSLRPAALETINEIRALVDKQCGPIVSCADVTALAARDSVFLSGGPNYWVPLGRRDGLSFATRNTTLASLPSPLSNVTVLLAAFSRLGLDTADLVALSGGHTIGRGHCSSFANRLYPSQDPIMNKSLAKGLYATCPTANTANTTVLDVRSPNTFDNKYYVDLMNRQGLFTSDQDLYTDQRTRGTVTTFAVDQKRFFEQFVVSIVKMGQLSVLTGTQGEIRTNCSARNAPRGEGLWSVLGSSGEGESAAL